MTLKWISVKERLPNDGQRVLATNGKDLELCVFHNNNVNLWRAWFVGWFAGDAGSLRSPEPYSYDKYVDGATHWIDLETLPGIPYENKRQS